MITVRGWYDKKNIGDDAFKEAFETGFKLSARNEVLNFYTSNVPKAKKMILGGGDVIRPFYLKDIPPETIVVPIGVGLGYESEAQLLKSHNVPFALVRNRKDVDVLSQKGIEASYCPDITFILPAPVKDVRQEQSGLRKKLVVLLSDEVNPTFEKRGSSEYMYYEFYKWELAAVLDELSLYYVVEFLPFSTVPSIDDRKMHLDVYRRMERRDKTLVHDEFASVDQARATIAQADLVLSMKYHGILFGVQSEVPVINIAETRKTQTFCQENGLSDFSVPKFSLEKDRLLEMVKLAEKDETKSRITALNANLRSQTMTVLPKALAAFSDL